MTEHTFGISTNGKDQCSLCPGEHGGPGPCDQRRYTTKQRRFLLVPWHLEAFVSAHYNPDKRAASSELARLVREYHTLPPRHYCWCVCPNVAHGRASCDLCKELQRNQKPQEPIAMGRTGAVHAPMPDTMLLDLMAGLLAA